MDTGGEFRYALMLRDGIASVPGIGDGEGAFVGDMLALGTVAGVPGRDFLSMLEAEGITMEFEAGLSGLRISGKAPEAKFPLLMQALLAISGERGPDMEEFGYYRSSDTSTLAASASRISARTSPKGRRSILPRLSPGSTTACSCSWGISTRTS